MKIFNRRGWLPAAEASIHRRRKRRRRKKKKEKRESKKRKTKKIRLVSLFLVGLCLFFIGLVAGLLELNLKFPF